MDASQTASITTLTTGLAAETTRANTAESALSAGLLSSNVVNASQTASITALSTGLSSTNVVDASQTASITTLTTGLAAETTRATGSESALSVGLLSSNVVNASQTASIVTLTTGLSSAVSINLIQNLSINNLNIDVSELTAATLYVYSYFWKNPGVSMFHANYPDL